MTAAGSVSGDTGNQRERDEETGRLVCPNCDGEQCINCSTAEELPARGVHEEAPPLDDTRLSPVPGTDLDSNEGETR